MAVLASTYTLIDWAKEHDQDGKPVRVINMLSKQMPLLKDLQWKEANMIDGHKTVIQSGLPEAIWRAFGQGTPPTKGTTAEVKFITRQAATRSVIDIDLAKLGGKPANSRMAKAESYMEAIKQKVQERIIYGANDGAGFPGLTHFYASLTGSNASENVISAGGSAGNQTSAFLTNTGEGKIFGIYPKGLPAGIEHLDLGNGGFVMESDGNGGTYPAYADEWRFSCGLAVEDWREGARVCNIDVSDINDGTSGYLDKLRRAMTKAHYRLPNGPGPGAFWQVPRIVGEALHNMAVENTKNGTLSIKEFAGEQITTFIGVPVRINDSILVTESVVS